LEVHRIRILSRLGAAVATAQNRLVTTLFLHLTTKQTSQERARQGKEKEEQEQRKIHSAKKLEEQKAAAAMAVATAESDGTVDPVDRSVLVG
jgi:tellurite resistance protein